MYFSFTKVLKWGEELKGDNMKENFWKTFKFSSEENESLARQGSQAAITTACCSDWGNNACSETNQKLALSTSTYPVYLPLQPKAAEQKSFGRGLQQVMQRSRTGRSWEMHDTIRTSHLMESFFLHFLSFPLKFMCFLGGFFCGGDFLTVCVFHAGVQWTISPLCYGKSLWDGNYVWACPKNKLEWRNSN